MGLASNEGLGSTSRRRRWPDLVFLIRHSFSAAACSQPRQTNWLPLLPRPDRSFARTAQLRTFSFHAACLHIVFIKYALRYAIRWTVQISRISGYILGLDALRLVVRINFAANHVARFQADGSDDTGTNIRATPAPVAAPEFKADGEIAVVHVGRACVLPNVRAEAGPTAKRQARAVENAPAHCAGLAF